MGYESKISRTPDAEQGARTLDNGASYIVVVGPAPFFVCHFLHIFLGEFLRFLQIVNYTLCYSDAARI